MIELSRRKFFTGGAGLVGGYFSNSLNSVLENPLGSSVKPSLTMLAQSASLGGRDFATFTEFGGIGDGSTNNDVAWQKIANWAAVRGYAGNTPKIKVQAGRYVSSKVPNLAINRLHIEFEGEVWLINTGSGHSFILDGGTEGAGVYGLKITGWPQIYGTSQSSHGIYARAIFNSELELNCRGAGAVGVGLYGEWLVDNKIKFIMSSNEGGLYSKPTKGMHLTARGVSEDTSYNDIEAKISGVDIGIYLDAALGNNIRSGSVQNCRLGLEVTRKAWDNKFWGTDFESNSWDFRDASRRLHFYGCDINTGGTFSSGSSGARVFGGRIESVAIAAGAENVLLSGMAYNRTGVGKLSDSGTQTRYRDVFNITANLSHDGPK